MVGLSNQISCNLVESVLRLPKYRKTERQFRERAMELLRVVELEQYADYQAANLPYGKQRKLEIARAMATNPSLLLLDEPAAGMNPHETEELMHDIAFIREKFDITILLIEHDMSLVSGICENVTVLNFGTELASGETAKVLADPVVVKAYLGD
jgi:branched-chain amino acid transport system ATP-binding protein